MTGFTPNLSDSPKSDAVPNPAQTSPAGSGGAMTGSATDKVANVSGATLGTSEKTIGATSVTAASRPNPVNETIRASLNETLIPPLIDLVLGYADELAGVDADIATLEEDDLDHILRLKTSEAQAETDKKTSAASDSAKEGSSAAIPTPQDPTVPARALTPVETVVAKKAETREKADEAKKQILAIRDQWIERFGQSDGAKLNIYRAFEILLERPDGFGDLSFYARRGIYHDDTAHLEQVNNLRTIRLKFVLEKLDIADPQKIERFLDDMHSLFWHNELISLLSGESIRVVDNAVKRNLLKEHEHLFTNDNLYLQDREKQELTLLNEESQLRNLNGFINTSSDVFVERYLSDAFKPIPKLTFEELNQILARKEAALAQLKPLGNKPTNIPDGALLAPVIDELVKCQIILWNCKDPLQPSATEPEKLFVFRMELLEHDDLRVLSEFAKSKIGSTKSIEEWAKLFNMSIAAVHKSRDDFNYKKHLPEGVVELDGIPICFKSFILCFVRDRDLNRLLIVKELFMLSQLLNTFSGQLDLNQLRFIRDAVCCEKLLRVGNLEELFGDLPYRQRVDMARRNEEYVRKHCHEYLSGQEFFISFVQRYLQPDETAQKAAVATATTGTASTATAAAPNVTKLTK